MKGKSVTFSIAVFLWAFFYIPITHSEASPSIIISEIQIQGDSANDEFIEIYNASSETQNLKDFKLAKVNLTDNSAKDSIKSFLRTPATIAPGQYYLWANSDGEFSAFADTTTKSYLAPENTFGLFYKNTLQDSFSWDSDARENMSAERNLSIPEPEWKFTNSPTPQNSRNETYKRKIPCAEKMPKVPLYISEIFPNPKNEDDEFIELYNTEDKNIFLKSWKIKDKNETHSFSDANYIDAKSYLVLKKLETNIELNNSGGNRIILIDENGKIVDEICYEKTKENVSLNYTSTGWRGGTPTPGTPNIINNLPETNEKVPKKGYSKVPVEFSAKGKDSDGDALKYTWDFGDGHKSYKEKTSHIYEKNGTYTVTLKTDDGREEMLETFTITIRSYAYPKIRITSFAPNPSGKDTDNEWIMLENQSKKKVNLKDYGIATGWKNLVNHPIREDFILKPKKETKLTREYSLFTLANQKGKIELRAPDGKVLQKIKYKLEKSIAEDAVYRKKNGARWNLEEMAEEPDDTNTETVSSDSEENNSAKEPTPASNDINANALPEENEEDSNSQETEGAVLGTSTITKTNEKISPIQYARNKKWLTLINTGTQVNVPENINFAPNDKEESKSQKSEHYAVSFARKAFSDINNSLNNMFNASQN